MKRKLSSKLIILILTIMTMLTGCANDNKYKQFLEEYYNKYFEIADLIELDDTNKTLIQLHDRNSIEKVSQIKVILDTYKNEIPKNKTDQYDKLYSWYSELEYLSEVHSKLESISADEKGEVLAKLREIDRRKMNWENKDSNTVWE